MPRQQTTVRNLRLAALTVAVVGGIFSFVTGTWQDGVLGLSVSLAIAIFGVGERVRGEDRAVGLALVIVGVIGSTGYIAQILFLG